MRWNDLQKDATWGYILIGVGIILLIWHPVDKLNAWLNDAGETSITVLLFIMILFYTAIAFFGSPTAKAAALVWVVTP